MVSTSATSSTKTTASQPKMHTPFFSDIPVSFYEDTPKDHIIDGIIEKILSVNFPELSSSSQNHNQESHIHDAPENDPDSADATPNDTDNEPDLSLPLLASNIRKLNARAGILLKIQGTFYHILSWHKPALTLSVLGIFTYTCLYPQLILCSPIIFLLAGIMAPGFDKRHPRSADNLPTKFYRRDPLEAEAEEFEVQELVETQNQRKREERERALVARIRDLQNFLVALVSAIDALDEFIHGIGSFKHESKATALYLVLLMTLISVVYVASFIPPSIAICGSTWIAVSLCHPLLQKKAKKTNNKYWKSRNRRSVADWFKEFQADDIIIDEPPEEREVEIFELQRQGLTPRQWTPWVFTPVVYELMSPLRMSMSRPPGTRFLSDVQPPEGWFFYEEDEVDNDGNDASWAIDPKVKDWVSHRGLRCLELDLDSAWAYDYLDEERGEWRRRRWLRKCYRHVATS